MIKFGMFVKVWKWHDMTHRDESFHGQGDGLAQALHRRSYIGSSAVSTINYNVYAKKIEENVEHMYRFNASYFLKSAV